MNFLKKVFIFLLILMVILTGCAGNRKTEQGKDQDSPNVTTTPSQESEHVDVEYTKPETENGEKKEDIEPCPKANEDGTIFDIQDSKVINGWKQLTIKDHSCTTEDWESYSFDNDSPMIAYTLHFPGDWSLEYSVFYNDKKEKIAELYPPIMMQPGQKLLENFKTSEYTELISQQEIQVGDLSGIKVVSKVYPSSGDIMEWYPHTYYLTDGEQVFAMAFYDMAEDSDNEEQYDKIIKTLRFLE